MNEYAILKLIHIGAFVFWLGPPLGAWLVFKAVEKDTDINKAVVAKVSKVFFWTVLLEHIAFFALLVTGSTLAYHYNWFGSEWLTQKLYIIFLIIVPLEIIDIIWGNWLASKASRDLYSGKILKPWQQQALNLYHGLFTKFALIIIPVTVLMVMYLAIGKSGL